MTTAIIPALGAQNDVSENIRDERMTADRRRFRILVSASLASRRWLSSASAAETIEPELTSQFGKVTRDVLVVAVAAEAGTRADAGLHEQQDVVCVSIVAAQTNEMLFYFM